MSKDNICISIVVPVYNVENYIEECLDSLISQTLKNIEIILIDDGSTDKSGIICDEYAMKYNNIVVKHQNNAGQSYARNEGVKIARGEYILFVDSDDYIVSTACETLYSYAIANNVDIVWGDMINSPNCGEINRAKKFPSYLKVNTCRKMLIEALDANAYDIVPWLKLFRTKLFYNYDLEFINGCYYEDQEFTLKMHLLDNVTMLRIDFPFYFYRPNRPGSTTYDHGLKKGTDFIKVIQKMIILIENTELEADVKSYAESVVAMAIYHLSSIYVLMNKENQKNILSMIDKKILKYSTKTKHLTKRMKIQNRLFLYFPHILKLVYSIKRNNS